MSRDHYAGAVAAWAEGASRVYRPIAEELLRHAPHPLRGRTVLDAGAGTGVASDALTAVGASTVGADLSFDMLAWNRPRRPPAVVCDILALPIHDDAVDDAVAAFVLNHVDAPVRALGELIRVTREGGAVLATVYASSSRSDARERIDGAVRAHGWVAPAWFAHLKAAVTPLLGTAEAMARAASTAGLAVSEVREEDVDVGVTDAASLVDYRLGQAHASSWYTGLGEQERARVRAAAIAAAEPVMEPYRPTVVFLSGYVP
ncbi:MAG: class I SAM-dependent methyltransferase [Acidimicrobiia bacterium]|nr:class I SAM-dependent methyltransferase [Acidimicrobiia bacterium]